MYKVVLIDDEPIIVEGLSRVVKWKDYDCEVVGCAEDAAGGAVLIRRENPDIVFTDICMPGDDGLVMLAGLRSEYPHMQVTVLSGYSDFSYAKEAIRLGVARYLVKPSKMDEILEALEHMTGKLREAGRSVIGAIEPIGPEDAKGAAEPKGSEGPMDPAKSGGAIEPKGPEDTNGAAEPKDPEETASGSFIIRQAMEYMETHYAQKLALQDVADHCYVSPWHLSKLLNRYVRKSFYDILNTIRIERAKKLLEDPRCRIGDISEMVGYVDTAHFSRVFKKIEGISANEYRNRKSRKDPQL